MEFGLFPKTSSHVYPPLSTVSCEHCGKNFGNEASLRYHRRVSHRKYKQKVDRLVFSDHDAKLKAVCEICGKVVLSRNFRSHQRRHTESYFFCVDCGKSFKTEAEQKSHAEIHGSTQVVCPECGLGFRSKAIYRNHRLRKHSDDAARKVERVMCTTCGKMLRRDTLQRHRTRMHPHTADGAVDDVASTSHSKHSCPNCVRDFTTPELLKKHLADPCKPFYCQICPMTFSSRGKAYYHNKTVHPEHISKKNNNNNNSDKAKATNIASNQSYSVTVSVNNDDNKAFIPGPLCTVPLPSPLLTYDDSRDTMIADDDIDNNMLCWAVDT